jgi:hypothetical protein
MGDAKATFDLITAAFSDLREGAAEARELFRKLTPEGGSRGAQGSRGGREGIHQGARRVPDPAHPHRDQIAGTPRPPAGCGGTGPTTLPFANAYRALIIHPTGSSLTVIVVRPELVSA